MSTSDLDALQHRLVKRGFRQNDPLLHECEACKQKAIVRYGIAGKVGGRDITLCLACGVARSWRSDPGMNDRVEDVGFDLRAFLA